MATNTIPSMLEVTLINTAPLVSRKAKIPAICEGNSRREISCKCEGRKIVH